MFKKYNHINIEKNKNKFWIENRFFSQHLEDQKPFSIILPPPNVTGELHIGHALDASIQDAIIRFKKLNNFDVLFLPSMDHAGIATQAKVEKHLLQEGISKEDLTKEQFIEKIKYWKDIYSQKIRKQWHKLGLGLDYENERFTLDDAANNAVIEVFIKMYNDGLIYKDSQAINWDPHLQTALSNIEVINKEVKSKLYYLKYYYEFDNNKYIEVATTRLETLESDVAVVVNPNDKRYIKFIGKSVINPLTNKKIPIITDESIEINFGTGAMKCSAHAKVDIDIIKKNNLEIIECINKDGKMNKNSIFYDLNITQARENIFTKLNNDNLVSNVEETISNVAYSERSNKVIEILVRPQWFVKMDKLSKKVIKHLSSKDKVIFHPKRFEDVLLKWMDNVYDWTISRQLVWGHRIPAWYKGDDIRVQRTSPGLGWTQDSDVLDTWFSSALSPFVFFDWPKNTKKFQRYFPTNLLVTGYDIIFFWVSRMYFQSLYILDKKPFNDVFIHGLIRDEQGRKMSKSLNNGINPMQIIDEYGVDAMRWFLLTNTTPGQDIRYSKEKMNSAWNINNKLWNAALFFINMKQLNGVNELNNNLSDADKWIENKLFILEREISKSFNDYKFTILGKLIHNFIFVDLSSWYIEMSKAMPNRIFALDILSKLMIILHPILPFITDFIYNEITKKQLLNTTWPKLNFYKNLNYIDDVISIVKVIREFRAQNKIAFNEEILFSSSKKLNEKSLILIQKMSNSQLTLKGDALITLDNFSIKIKLSKKLKENDEIRLKNEIEKLEFEVGRSKSILSNQKFMINAPKEKIVEEQTKYEMYKNKLLKLKKEKLKND